MSNAQQVFQSCSSYCTLHILQTIRGEADVILHLYSLLQVTVLQVHLKWLQCYYSKALKSRACVKGGSLCICFVPCVAWWQQFVMYTGKVTAVTLARHLAEMTLLCSSHDLRIALFF